MGRAFFLSLLLVSGAAAEDWGSCERRVSKQLRQKDVGTWALELTRQPMPGTLDACFERLIVVALAGHADEARRVLDHLSERPPERQRAFRPLGDFFIGREDWALAQHAHDRLPHMACGWTYVLVRHLAETEDPDVVERWLKRQAARSDHWFLHRLGFAHKRGKAEPLLVGLERAVHDLASLRLLLTAVRKVDSKRNLDWLPGQLRPDSAYASYRIGCELPHHYDAIARIYFERALKQPLSEAERERIARESRDDPAELVTVWTKQQLMRLFHRNKQPQRAQALLEELAARYPDGIPYDFVRLAGQIQAASGANVVRKRVEKAPGKDTPAYWLTRARYFAGRKKSDEVHEAYRQALRLARDPQRRSIVDEYAEWMLRVRQHPAAERFLLAEFERIEPGSDAAAQIMNDLRKLPPRGEVAKAMWLYLEQRPRWEIVSQRTLESFADGAEGFDQRRGKLSDEGRRNRDAIWNRATALTRRKHTSRALRLAWVMLLRGEQVRAAALLAGAIERMPDSGERQRARYTLFRAYRESGNYKAALAAWPDAREILGPHEECEKLGTLAVCAARAGAFATALRIWEQRTNLDRMDLRSLDDMVEAGLQKPLIEFYGRLAKRDPRSEAPARALAMLR